MCCTYCLCNKYLKIFECWDLYACSSSTNTWFMYVGAHAIIYLLTVAELMKPMPETWFEDVNISVVVITVVL